MQKLGEYEENLVDLVHFLAQPNGEEAGVTLRDIKTFLTTPIPSHGNATPLQLIQRRGRAFVNEVIIYIRQSED